MSDNNLPPTEWAQPEPSTFVLVDSRAPAAYWEDYATPCGSGVFEPSGLRGIIVSTKRLGKAGRSDAQYIIDRLASGMYPAHIQERSE